MLWCRWYDRYGHCRWCRGCCNWCYCWTRSRSYSQKIKPHFICRTVKVRLSIANVVGWWLILNVVCVWNSLQYAVYTLLLISGVSCLTAGVSADFLSSWQQDNMLLLVISSVARLFHLFAYTFIWVRTSAGEVLIPLECHPQQVSNWHVRTDIECPTLRSLSINIFKF